MTFPVAGVFFDYGSDQGIVMMSRQTYDRSWDDPGVTSLGLFVEAGASADGVVERVRTLLDPGMQVVVRSNQALKTLSLEVFDRTFAVTAVLRTLAFVVAFIAVVSALMALQLERARELGVLRANGLTPEQVWHLVTAQTGLMGFIAGLMAMPMGIALAAVMILVVNKRSFGWTLQMELGPEFSSKAWRWRWWARSSRGSIRRGACRGHLRQWRSAMNDPGAREASCWQASFWFAAWARSSFRSTCCPSPRWVARSTRRSSSPKRYPVTTPDSSGSSAPAPSPSPRTTGRTRTSGPSGGT